MSNSLSHDRSAVDLQPFILIRYRFSPPSQLDSSVLIVSFPRRSSIAADMEECSLATTIRASKSWNRSATPWVLYCLTHLTSSLVSSLDPRSFLILGSLEFPLKVLEVDEESVLYLPGVSIRVLLVTFEAASKYLCSRAIIRRVWISS